MPGKPTLGQHLVAAKFASLKGFLISSDEDDYSDEELDTSTQQKQKHIWLDDDDEGEEEAEAEEEEEPERGSCGKNKRSSVANKGSSSEMKRLRHQQRRGSQQPPSSPPCQRPFKSKIKDIDKKMPSREVMTSSDGEEEAVDIDSLGEKMEIEEEAKCLQRPAKQGSKVKASTGKRSLKEQQMITRPTLKKDEVAQEVKTTGIKEAVAGKSHSLGKPPVPTPTKGKKLTKNSDTRDTQEICSNLKNWTKSIVPHYEPTEKETNDILSGNFAL
uniref:Uncharacterized protein n=1 Tax=Echinococcus canadensis TaxID=519352 RepID=A0A915EWM1_9CEST